MDEKSIFREKSEANSHSQKVKISLETLEFRVTYKNIPNIPYSLKQEVFKKLASLHVLRSLYFNSTSTKISPQPYLDNPGALTLVSNEALLTA